MPRRVPTHRAAGHADPAASRRSYERRPGRRDDIAFYQSPPWTSLRALKLGLNPLCERCDREARTTAATHVHHVSERKQRPDLALDLDNLESLCGPCHSRHHARQPKARD